VALALVEDLAADLLAATLDGQRRRALAQAAAGPGDPPPLILPPSSSQRRRAAASLSTWDAAAAEAVKGLPVAATGGSLSLVVAAGSVSYDPGSVEVNICRFDDPCIAPTPGPTIARPSQVEDDKTFRRLPSTRGCLGFSPLPPSPLLCPLPSSINLPHFSSELPGVLLPRCPPRPPRASPTTR
jgi:hypothetical protein